MKLLTVILGIAILCFAANAQVAPGSLTLPVSGLYPGQNWMNVNGGQFNSTTLLQVNSTIWQYLLSNPVYSNLTALATQNGLVEFINILNTTTQNVLFFAPDNTAFSQVPFINSTGLWTSLNQTLFFHLVESVPSIGNIGTLPFFNASRVEYVLTNLAGGIIRLDNYTVVPSLGWNLTGINQLVTINGIPLLGAGYSLFNGQLVNVENLLLPVYTNLTSTIPSYSNFTILSAFLSRASPYVLDILNSQGVTFFAPTDTAFNNFNAQYNGSFTASVLQNLTQAQFDATLLNHAVRYPFSLFSVAVNNTLYLNSTLNLLETAAFTGINMTSAVQPIVLNVLNNTQLRPCIGIFCALVSLADLPVSNGVVHAIDSLLPPLQWFPQLQTVTGTA